ncbi:MAG: S8 family serine peptidase, partial [Gemmatimonadota bacterium]
MRRSSRIAAAAAIFVFSACSETVSPPVEQPDLGQSHAIADQFIVVLQDNAPAGLERRMSADQGDVLFVYETAIRGFAFRGSAQVAEALVRNPFVAYVEQDRIATLHATQSPTPAWGIDRIDQRDLPLDDSFTHSVDGSGVNVYVLDTGIRLSHDDFGGRANYIPNGNSGDFVNDGHGSAADCHGHGTHVAGSAAGSSFGVAKGATIWSGRVVNCQGSGNVSMAIAGVDWITANGKRPAAVNMSLGYGNVQSLRDAVENSIAAGFNYAVSAGNGNFAGIPQDACAGSPAGATNANTVGATASDDDEASFSNYGTCVDILGPGVAIRSAWYTGDAATASLSGTSMSSPHVAGAIALYIEANPGSTPQQVTAALTSNASVNKIRLHRRSRQNNTPNLLLYTAFIGGGAQNQSPTASFTFSCTDLTCEFDGNSSTDPDGTITAYSWDFGDGSVGTGVTTTHTYAAGGNYAVTLTVTDNEGATGDDTQNVSIATAGGLVLTTSGYKLKGRNTVDLTWSGATFANVDVYRDGSLIQTTSNDGAFTDATGTRGGITYVYQVCEAGTSTCSNTSTVV